MKLTHRALKTSVLAYLALPVLIFACGFMRWQLSLPVCAAILTGFFFARRDSFEPRFEKTMTISIKHLLSLTGVLLLWSWLGGLNGLFYQSDDWPWRNAIFHDLVEKDWPVIYPERGSALVYYIGFWLPAALPAKLVGWMTGSVSLAWRTAQGALWLWTSAGLLLTALMLMLFTGAEDNKKQWIVVLIFIFFSGMDVIGMLLKNRTAHVMERLHMDWWMIDGKQFSSMTTCLYWVFNQSIVPWLATICFLMEKDARNYLFLGAACLCCGPLPLVGLAILMMARWAAGLIIDLRAHQGMRSVKAALSLPNIILLALVFPALMIYFLGNLSVANTAAAQPAFLDQLSRYFSKTFIMFYLLEVGVYLLLLCSRHKREPLFYAVAVSLLIIPFFHVGSAEDFCLRASIPGVFIVMAWCAECLAGKASPFKTSSRFSRICAICLVCALLIGSLTPLMEMYRGISHVVREKTILLAQDDFGSIGVLDEAANFTAANYSDTLFFKYFSR